MSSTAQTTRDLFMVRPAHFGSNAETAVSNVFQQLTDRPAASLEIEALAEFDGMVQDLRAAGVRLIVIDDTGEPRKPDAIFPNNWVTTHASGNTFLFPLEAPGRRAERRMDIIRTLSAEHGFTVRKIVDLSVHESEGKFLEGTGSMVLDRVNRIAYAARSTRTHPELLGVFAREAGYEAVAFDTLDSGGRPIYHTNVMLAIGSQFVMICAAAICDARRRAAIIERLAGAGREVIEITMQQMTAFAGNLLEVQGEDGAPLIVLSKTAHAALTAGQRTALQAHGKLLPIAVDTIERVGGGSVRCMLAEIFLPVADSLSAGG